MCTITDEQWNWFKDQYEDISPCQEYGQCEDCPYYKKEEE